MGIDSWPDPRTIIAPGVEPVVVTLPPEAVAIAPNVRRDCPDGDVGGLSSQATTSRVRNTAARSRVGMAPPPDHASEGGRRGTAIQTTPGCPQPGTLTALSWTGHGG